MSSRTADAWVVAFGFGDLNPLSWLGDAASEAAAEAWTAAMVASWSSAMWILGLAFRGVDMLTSPDLSANGPMAAIYPYTFGLGAVVAVVMAFLQLGLAAFRRDGQSLARLLVGVLQFGAVWLGYVGVASALVVAMSGLTNGLLDALLGIDGFAGYQPAEDWPRRVNDTVTATVLGVCAWLLIWPASIAYLLLMLVREAALLLLAATSPIAAGGLLSETGRAWFWKSLRWFLASLLIAPLAALVLGVGQKITEGVVSGAGDDTAAVGMAVVGSVLVLIGALCPLVLFRLLAFVDPGTSSGAAMRTALVAQGGLSGLLSRPSSGSGDAASRSDGAGRSAGEAGADAATSSRFAAGSTGALAAVGAVGSVAVGAAKLAQGAVTVSSDILSSSGVGHQHPYYPPYHPVQSGQRAHRSSSSPSSHQEPTPPPATSLPAQAPPMVTSGPSAPVSPATGAAPQEEAAADGDDDASSAAS